MNTKLEAMRIERDRNPSGDVTQAAREALRRANARSDTRWRDFGRSLVEITGSVAVIVVIITVLGFFAKLAFLAWVWILS